MSNLLKPAIAMANKMSFTAKLFLAVLIFLVPFVLILTVQLLDSWQEILKIEKQQNGLELIVKLKPIALDVAKHRGNMAQYLSGAVEKESAILAIEKTPCRAMFSWPIPSPIFRLRRKSRNWKRE